MRVPSTIGTLIAKIQRQYDAVSTKAAWPISGPSTVPMPPQASAAPTAWPRLAGSATATVTASAAGVARAPATPWSARPATSSSMVGASAQNSEVTPKAPTRRANTRRSPKRSPSEPPISSREPSVTR